MKYNTYVLLVECITISNIKSQPYCVGPLIAKSLVDNAFYMESDGFNPYEYLKDGVTKKYFGDFYESPGSCNLFLF